MSDKYEDMAEDADRYIDLLSEMQGFDQSLIELGLRSEYDVMVTEALDYIINLGKVDSFQNIIESLAKEDASYLVVGRLILCEALCSSSNLRRRLKNIKYDRSDDYYRAWEESAEYIKSGDVQALHRVEALSTSSDHTVASLSKSLLGFLSRRAVST